MDALLADDARTKRIADNSYEFWKKWISPGSIDCYWRRLFREWAKVQTFTVEFDKEAVDYNSFRFVSLLLLLCCTPLVASLTLSFSHSLMGKVHWDPY
jgi:hypothetical protein